MNDTTTKTLVYELSARKGVEKIIVESCRNVQVKVNGEDGGLVI